MLREYTSRESKISSLKVLHFLKFLGVFFFLSTFEICFMVSIEDTVSVSHFLLGLELIQRKNLMLMQHLFW